MEAVTPGADFIPNQHSKNWRFCLPAISAVCSKHLSVLGKRALTRSRPYKKDDIGHVEHTNWTHVRQLLGYDRLGEPQLVEPINAPYRECWEPLHNYFLPSAKLEAKTREGAKVKRRHDKPLTPCERLLGSPDMDAANKRKLREQRAALNPFELHRRLEEGLRAFLHRALHSSRPTDSLHCALDAGKNSHLPVSCLLSQRLHRSGLSPVSFTFESTGHCLLVR